MKRKALLVGIDDYAPTGNGGPDLGGCINDIRDMANTLTVLGIIPSKPANLKIITNHRATKSRILEGIRWLSHNAAPGDLLIFHYSGHGSQTLDLNGDEPDGKDETICPHDFETAGMLTDDLLRSHIDQLPDGVRLEIILDSCHSGTATRDLPHTTPNDPATPTTNRTRYIEPPPDWGFFIDSEPTLPIRGILKQQRRPNTTLPPIRHILWAGCRENQTSAEGEFDGRERGIFTANFCKILRAAGPGITRKELIRQIARNIKGQGYSQIPQLEGPSPALNSPIFS